MAKNTDRPETFRAVLLEHVITVWKRKWLVLAAAWVVCIAGWTAVLMIPQRFESNARAYIDVNGLLAPLLKGLVVDTSAQETEDYLRQTLMSRPNLDQVIELADLSAPGMTSSRHEGLLKGLANDIKVTTEGNNLVSITYANRDPHVAKNVVEALLTIFAEKAANSSRAEMDRARNFLSGQIAQYETQLRSAEERRAAFRRKYADYFINSGVARPDALLQQLVQVRQQYEDAQATKNAIAAQLAQVPQLLSVPAAPAVSNTGQIVVASPETRLAQAKRKLADLRLLYTDKHPDVIEAQRSVAELQADVSAQAKTGGSSEGKTQISNPAYEQLRLRLVDAEALLPSLKGRLDRVTVDYNHAKSLSGNLPEIEAKSQDIDRDYDVIKTNYDELVKRRESANLSQAAEDRADRTQFRIVDPPQVPIFPDFPNRFLLFTMATIFGLAAGIATPLLLTQVHPVFASQARLRDLGLPVIGAVTYVRGVKEERYLERAAGAVFVTGMACLLLVYAGLVMVAARLHQGTG